MNGGFKSAEQLWGLLMWYTWNTVSFIIYNVQCVIWKIIKYSFTLIEKKQSVTLMLLNML